MSWAETVDPTDRLAFGVDSHALALWDGLLISQIHSPAVERASPNGRTITIPVFDPAAMERIRKLCLPVSQRLAEIFSTNVR